MKIALVIPHFGCGGAERVMSLLHNQFQKKHDVKLIIFSEPIEYKVYGEIVNLHLPTRKNFLGKVFIGLKRIIALKKIFHNFKPDLVISFIGNLQAILTFYPVVVSIRIDTDYTDEFSKKWLHKIQYMTIYKLPNVKKIVTVSKGIECKLRERYKFKNIQTIYNPIDFKMIKYQTNGEKPVVYKYILAVGSLKTQNAFDLLIRAYGNSKAKNAFKLLILGEGNQRKELESLVAELNLKDCVYLPGKVENPFIFMKYSSVFVLSSLYEGFPNVLIEALACGAACISTDCETGPAEIIDHNENGVLIPVNNPSTLQEAIDDLIENPLLLEKIRRNAVQSVSHLDVNKISSNWLNLPKKNFSNL